MFTPGGILAYAGRHYHSDAINLVTYGVPRWGISHVGVVAECDGQLSVWESNDEPLACQVLGDCEPGVAALDIAIRLETYHGRIWYYPLIRPLTVDQQVALTEFLLSHLHTPYDAIGALRAGGAGFSMVESWLRPADLSSLFCSELVAAALHVAGVFDTDHVSRYNPNRLLRKLNRQRKLLYPVRLR